MGFMAIIRSTLPRPFSPSPLLTHHFRELTEHKINTNSQLQLAIVKKCQVISSIGDLEHWRFLASSLAIMGKRWLSILHIEIPPRRKILCHPKILSPKKNNFYHPHCCQKISLSPRRNIIIVFEKNIFIAKKLYFVAQKKYFIAKKLVSTEKIIFYCPEEY